MRVFLKQKFVTLGGAAALCLAGLAAAPVAAQDNRIVVSRSSNSLAFLTYFAASAMGYFDELGLEIEEVRSGSGTKSLAAMAAGDAHVYIGATASAFKAREQGLPIKIIAPVVTQQTSDVVVTGDWAEKHGVTADSPIEQKLAALRGARIAVSAAGAGSDQGVRYIMAEAGLDPERDAEIVAMGNNAATYLSAMEAGQIDGFSMSPPDTYWAERQIGAVNLIRLSKGELPGLDGYFFIGLQSLEPWLAENPDTAARLVAGLQMGMDAIHDPARHAEVGEAVYNKYYPEMDKDLFTTVWRESLNTVPKSIEMTHEMMKPVVEFHNRFSEDKLSEDSISEVMTNEVVEAAKALLPTN